MPRKMTPIKWRPNHNQWTPPPMIGVYCHNWYGGLCRLSKLWRINNCSSVCATSKLFDAVVDSWANQSSSRLSSAPSSERSCSHSSVQSGISSTTTWTGKTSSEDSSSKSKTAPPTSVWVLSRWPQFLHPECLQRHIIPVGKSQSFQTRVG